MGEPAETLKRRRTPRQHGEQREREAFKRQSGVLCSAQARVVPAVESLNWGWGETQEINEMHTFSLRSGRELPLELSYHDMYTLSSIYGLL